MERTALEGSVALTLPFKPTKKKATGAPKQKTVPVALHLPAAADEDGPDAAQHAFAVLLCPSAGGDMAHGSLPALAAALAAAGVPALRFTCKGGDFDYRCAVTAALLQRCANDGGGDVLTPLARVRRWVVAGTSMGARCACVLAADGRAEAVALLSYPLVANSGDAANNAARAALLEGVRVPALLIRGTKDASAPQGPWDAAVAALRRGTSAACEELVVDGGNHSLKVPGGAPVNAAAQARILQAVVHFVRERRDGAAAAAAPAAKCAKR